MCHSELFLHENWLCVSPKKLFFGLLACNLLPDKKIKFVSSGALPLRAKTAAGEIKSCNRPNHSLVFFADENTDGVNPKGRIPLWTSWILLLGPQSWILCLGPQSNFKPAFLAEEHSKEETQEAGQTKAAMSQITFLAFFAS